MQILIRAGATVLVYAKKVARDCENSSTPLPGASNWQLGIMIRN